MELTYPGSSGFGVGFASPAVVQQLELAQLVQSDSVGTITITLAGSASQLSLSPLTQQDLVGNVAITETVVPGTLALASLTQQDNLQSITIPGVVVSQPGYSGLVFIYDDTMQSAALSATSTFSGFDVNNIAKNNKSAIWRSNGLADQTITAIWSEFKSIDSVGMAFTNMVAGSSFRVRAYTLSGDSSPVYDSGFIDVSFAYDPPIGFSTIGYKSFPYGGGNYLSHLFDEQQCQKLEITLRSANNPDAAIEVSRIIAGQSLRMSIGASYGANVMDNDETENVITDGGDVINDIKTARKKISFEVQDMPQSDKKKLANMMRRIGKRIPVYASLRNDLSDSEDRQHFQIFGIVVNDGLSRTNFDLDTTSIEITEQ